jgi:NAD(P)-dependent dehydrogenase (short-subunit alcohol dehydrogenase family)
MTAPETAPFLDGLYSLSGKVAVVTGATGVLGGAMARGLSRAGAHVGVLGRRRERAEEVAAELSQGGAEAMALPADVLDRGQLEAARDAALRRWGRIDLLLNAAGGNVSGAIVGEEDSFFGLSREALGQVSELNFMGTVLPTQVFGEAMVRGDGEAEGSIVNVSSMAAQRPLTRVVGYAAAKAAVENLTKWLAAELARKCGSGLRVNAVAPGFFIGEQNRALLTNEDGSLTDRGQTIIEHTPAGHFGQPEDLVGVVVRLSGPGASFINGIVIPVDGGFSAFGGV